MPEPDCLGDNKKPARPVTLHPLHSLTLPHYTHSFPYHSTHSRCTHCTHSHCPHYTHFQITILAHTIPTALTHLSSLCSLFPYHSTHSHCPHYTHSEATAVRKLQLDPGPAVPAAFLPESEKCPGPTPPPHQLCGPCTLANATLGKPKAL